MKILRFFVFSAFFVVLISQGSPVRAALDGFNSDCLDARITAENGHTARLTFPAPGKYKLPQAGVRTWVFVCISTPRGQKCTSGVAEIDDSVFGKHTDLTDIQNMPEFTTKTVGGVKNNRNPDATTSDAANPQFINEILWFDEYSPAVSHMWSWVQQAVPREGAGTGAGSAGAQQQATFDFIHKKSESSECTKISWDPKGYVFDAKTLYPVKDVSVMISKKMEDETYVDIPNGLGITNPDISHPLDGQYSFYTPDGWYKLRIVSSNAQIAHLTALTPQEQGRIHSLFALENPHNSTIYQDNYAIHEVGGVIAVSHMPVLLTGTSEASLIKTLSVVQRAEERLVGGENEGDLLLTGSLSHPKTIIKPTITYVGEDAAKQKKTYVEAGIAVQEVANEIGEYKFIIPQTKIIDSIQVSMTEYQISYELNPAHYPGASPQTKGRNIKSIFVQVLNTVNSFFNRVVHAASPDLSFSGKPIPSYIEGIAYDSKGVAIPRAIVGLYPSFSEKPMYVTVANESGRYKIGSQHIPQYAYFLRYKKVTGEVIQIDTTTFIKQNITLFATENVKPFVQKNTTPAEDKKVQDFFTSTKTAIDLKLPEANKVASSNNNNRNDGFSNSSSTRTPAEKAQPTSGGKLGSGIQGIVMIFVVLMVLVMLGVGAFIMMKSKQQPPPLY